MGLLQPAIEERGGKEVLFFHLQQDAQGHPTAHVKSSLAGGACKCAAKKDRPRLDMTNNQPVLQRNHRRLDYARAQIRMPASDYRLQAAILRG
jgi:hypothetical protein